MEQMASRVLKSLDDIWQRQLWMISAGVCESVKTPEMYKSYRERQ